MATGSSEMTTSVSLNAKPRLCRLCSGMTLEDLCRPEGHKRMINSEDMLASAFCPICRIILGADLWPAEEDLVKVLAEVASHEREELTYRLEQSAAGTLIQAYGPGGLIRNHFKEGPQQGYHWTTNTWFQTVFATIKEGSVAERLGLTSDYDRMFTGSPFHISRARQWITECESKHTCVRATFSDESSRWPARLLEIGDNIRLVSVAEGDRPSYATLSYCWGPRGLSDGAKTTLKTISEREKEIDKSTLPRTFQDAITLLAQLDLRYLWIDALCIVQDSLEDWQQEGANMGNIYSHSVVTLAAESGADADAGLFFQISSPDDAVSHPIAVSDGSTATLTLYSTVQRDLRPNQSDLSSRAWCLQERILSPRILHFFDCGVLWECRDQYHVWVEPTLLAPDGSISQVGCHLGSGLGESDDRYRIYIVEQTLRDVMAGRVELCTSMRDDLLATVRIPETLNPERYVRPWYLAVLPEYTSRKITFASDKLPALSSLAHAFQRRLGDSYIAGLWSGEKGDIAMGLAFTVGTPGDQLKPTRRPTWSWAAYDAKCYWPMYDPGYHNEPIRNVFLNIPDSYRDAEVIVNMDLVSHTVELASPDPYGAVLKAQLTVFGIAFRGSCRSGTRDTGRFDMCLECSDGTYKAWYGLRWDFQGGDGKEIEAQSWDPEEPIETLCFLLGSKGSVHYFLALRKVVGEDMYEREDMFCIDGREYNNGDTEASKEYAYWFEWKDAEELVLV